MSSNKSIFRARLGRMAGLLGLLVTLFDAQCSRICDAAPPTTEVRRFCLAAYHGDILDIRHYLKRNPGLVHGQDEGWTSAVDSAARGNHPEIIRMLSDVGADYLLDLGADLNDVDRNRKTPLIYAVETLNVDVVCFLVDECAGLQIDLVPPRGSSALCYAVDVKSLKKNSERDRDEMVRILLAGGADPNLKNDGGLIALDRAVAPSVRDLLKNAPAIGKSRPAKREDSKR